jgi:hypothetical protein
MVKYFLKVSFTLLFLTLLKNIVFAEVKLISPYNGEVLEDRVVNFKWENTDRDTEYVYQHVIYINGQLNDTRLKIEVGSEEEYTWGYVDNQHYFWEIRYEPKESFNGYYNHKSDVFVFGLKTDIPDWAWDMSEEYNNPPQEEEDEETEIEETEKDGEEIEEVMSAGKKEKKTTSEEESKEETLSKKVGDREGPDEPPTKTTRNIPIKIKTQPASPTIPLVQEEDYNWNIKNSSVLGISNRGDEKETKILCRFKYNKRDNSFEKISCKKSTIEILREEVYPFSNEYSLYVEGNVERNINIQVDTYDCVSDIFKPKTWFRCNEKFLGSEIITIRPHLFFRTNQNGSDVPVRSFSMNGDRFKLLAGYTKNREDLKLTHTYRIINRRYDIFYDLKTELSLDPEDIEETTTKGEKRRPFAFPFNKIIGVTQWYGFTNYQSPHTGIDFGATKEKVVSVGDGEVVGKGWDSYYGKCLSGGNFLKVKHPKGMHTTYFHLEDMYVNTGDLVKKGQTIAKSGNTGAWNCQKLAYHLHFETRLNSSYKSHTNPVPYIDVDWNKVPTLGAKYNPGRLSGENPHPGR